MSSRFCSKKLLPWYNLPTTTYDDKIIIKNSIKVEKHLGKKYKFNMG